MANNITEAEIKVLVDKYLENKERTNYYEFNYISNEYGVERGYLNPLDEDDHKKMLALEQKYGKDMIEHLAESFPDEDEVHDFSAGQELTCIDLHTVYHLYRINQVYADGDKAKRFEFKAEISDEDYATLLFYAVDEPFFSVNTLRYRNPELFNRLICSLDYACNRDSAITIECPYTFELTEISEDANNIKEADGIPTHNGHFCYWSL